jgi:PhoPQ-activated pathogenicity-related protein
MKPFDEYVSAIDENYGWYEVENSTFKSLWGGTGHVLNVTSQKWLDESKVYGPDGALWTHEVIVVIPKNLKFTNVSFAYLTGGCNENQNPKIDPYKDEDVLVVDEASHNAHVIGITVK